MTIGTRTRTQFERAQLGAASSTGLGGTVSGTLDVDVQASAAPLRVTYQVGAGVLAAVLATTALYLGLSVDGLQGSDILRAAANAGAVVFPVEAGLFALRREQTRRFGRLLVITGLAWAPIALATSDNSVAYSVGRLWAWMVLSWLTYLLLAFPTGRLMSRLDRQVVAWSWIALVVLYLPTVFFLNFPGPSPWSGCTADCPANAFQSSGTLPGWFETAVSVRDLVSFGLFFVAGGIVGMRWVRGSTAVRRAHGPVLAIASFDFAVAATFVLVRRLGADDQVVEAVGLVFLLVTLCLVLALVAGLVRWRVLAHATWKRLSPTAAPHVSAEQLRALLGDAIRDPSLEVGYWGGAERGWIDDAGLSFPSPPRGSVRARTQITSGEERIALFVHEDSNLVEPALREVMKGVALMALRHQRSEAEARAALRELTDSRSRIMAAIDRDRLRVERDLHDGAQQRLIALKVAADRGADTASEQTDDVSALFKRIATEASAALDEVRALARGVYPSLLVDHGLVAALDDSAKRTSIPTEVRARGIRRYPQEIEAAVYFACLEALQNAEKHSRATSITMEISEDGDLRFEVRDNGRGFDPGATGTGAGLGNMGDRIATVGGTVRVDSVKGGGTRISGRVPMLLDRVPEEMERLVLRAADALEDAMGIYRVVRTSSGTIVDFAVDHVNEAACKMRGLTREDQVGKTLGQLTPGYHRSPAFHWHCEALDANGPLVHEELEYTGFEGDRRLRAAYEVRAAPLGAGRLALVWRDITDRKRAEHQLRLRADALGRERDGVCIVRAATGTIVYANPYLEEMLGYGIGELEGRPASALDWVEPDSQTRNTPARWFAPDRFAAKCRRKNGEPIFCEVTIDGFDDSDLGWCWVAAHHDVTADMAADAALKQERAQLDEALRILPALAWSSDVDLRCTLLFDNLVDRNRVDFPASGADAELFGPALAPHVNELNRRVLVTGLAAEVVVDSVLLTARPVFAADGQMISVAGSAVERPAAQHVSQPGAAGRRLPGRRRRAQ